MPSCCKEACARGRARTKFVIANGIALFLEISCDDPNDGGLFAGEPGNGSAFAGLSANTLFYNLSGAMAMAGRWPGNPHKWTRCSMLRARG